MGPTIYLATGVYTPPYQVPPVSYQEVAGMMAPPLKLTIYQRIVLVIVGRVFLFNRVEPGWSEHGAFYAFRCRVHGLVVNRPHGYNDDLWCPKCLNWAVSE